MIIGIIVSVAFVLAMTLLAPKMNIENARASTLGDFQFPRAKEGDPVPIVWGTVRLRAPNVIWYGDFRAEPITEKVKTGLFSSKRVTTGYRYYVGLDLALCLGPNVQLRKLWAGKYVPWSGLITGESTFNIDQPELFGGEKQQGGMKGDVTFYPGTFTQSRDPYLAEKVDPAVPRYGGVSHMVFKGFYIGTTTNLQAFNMEVSCLSDSVAAGFGIMPNGLDVNPVEILYDALTAKWGRLGMDPGLVDGISWRETAIKLYNEGNGMSLKLEGGVTGKTVADEIMRQIDGLLYQSPETMKIYIKLLRQDYDVLTLPILDESIVKSLSNFAKTTWDSTFNQCRVTFTNRERDYEDGVATAQDFANINFQQRVRSTALSFPACTDPTLASQLASRGLGVYSVPLYKCDLVCNRKASTLRPGDVFILSWDPFGLSEMVMRVQKVDLGDLTSGEVKISAIQDKFATNHMVFAPPEPSAWVPIDTNPAKIIDPLVFEVPRFLEIACGINPGTGLAATYALVKRPSTRSLSYDMEVSTNPAMEVTYTSLDNTFYGVSARLVVAYPDTAGGDSNYDVSATGIKIELIDDASAAGNRTTAQERAGEGLLYINGEILSYSVAVNNADGSITLRNIRRCFLDTPKATHAIGSQMFFVNSQDGLGETYLPNSSTAYFRFRDNTASATMPIGQATLAQLPLTQRAVRPAPVTYLRVGGSLAPTPKPVGTLLVLDWRERNRNSQTLVWFDDATQTPESGTTYTVERSLDGGVWQTLASSLTSATYSFTPTVAGSYRLRVVAKRNGLDSAVVQTLTQVIT